MIFVIDSNILISALIKDSVARKIIIESEWMYYYPEVAFHEIRKYKEMILEKSGMTEFEYFELLDSLLKHIILVPQEQFSKNLQEANEILGTIDVDDVVFLAVAMSIQNSTIWSNDHHLHQQHKVMALKTEDVVKLL
ncbi:MAG: PIN domain-containing protein [Nanoarchaeota archaeon]